MKTSRIILHLFFVLIVLALIQACENDTSTTEVEQIEDIAQEAIEDYENYRLKINLMDSSIFEFPSPVELAQSYKASGIRFIPGITNPPENYENYQTMVKKSLNFGIYSADLSYCVMNEQGQSASDYIQAMQSLSELIGLTEIFRYEVILSNFNRSIGNKDSMASLIKGIQSDLDETLLRDGAQDKAILFYTGAWVESAYIASNAPANFTNSVDTSTLNRMADQMRLLDNISHELDQIEDKTIEINELRAKIQSFKKATMNIRITTSEDSVIINPIDLGILKSEIESLRAFIVS